MSLDQIGLDINLFLAMSSKGYTLHALARASDALHKQARPIFNSDQNYCFVIWIKNSAIIFLGENFLSSHIVSILIS